MSATRVFVAGATGVVGRRLVPALVAHGYDVTAMTRSPEKANALHAAGATPVVADALHADAVRDAVARSGPNVIVHELTSLGGARSYRNFDAAFAMTNRLRTEGTDNLLAAARASGVRRFIAQSYGGWTYERRGSMVKSEEAPLDPSPPRTQRRTLNAIRYLERALVEATDVSGIALRYGSLYGPGTNLGPHGEFVELVRKRRLPIIGSGSGVWSFLHVDDAASAVLAAIEHGESGTYNVADDDPAPVATWLPELARAVHAKPPRHVPEWLGRLLAGEATASMMTRVRGISNAKARRELHWQPTFPSWREVFPSFQSDFSIEPQRQVGE
jgi:nucleoside-diphosphate-sugar epimerase